MRSVNWVFAIAMATGTLAACQAEAGTQSTASTENISSVASAGNEVAEAIATSEEQAGHPENLLHTADQSFSPYPLAQETLGLNQQGFSTVEGSCSPEGDECTWVDGNSVQHVLDSNNILVFKLVSASDFVDRPMTALGIGAARSRPAVLRNVAQFLPGTALECREAGQAGEGPGVASCGAMLGEGWIKILFDSDNQLISARIDAYQVN